MIKNCVQCQAPFEVSRAYKKKRFCSPECSGLNKRKGTEVSCFVCGKIFWQFPSRPQIHCSKSCMMTTRNKTDKNPSLHRDITGDKNPMFGRGLKGADNPMFGKVKELNPNWKGGRLVRKDGYVMVSVPDNHPYGVYKDKNKSSSKYVLEHRLVMEQHIGRYLLPEEVVHHIDENPSNNHISNLQLFASQEEHITQGHGTRH